MKKRVVSLLLLLAPVMILPGRATAGGITADCPGTLASWRTTHPELAKRCSCNGRSTGLPDCDGSTSSGSGGSPRKKGGENKHDFSSMVTQTVMQSFLDAMLKGAASGGNGFPVPPPPATTANPVYLDAWRKLQGLRLPPAQAEFVLAEALRSQRQALSPYRPGDALQQLALSRCLTSRAAKRAEKSEWEEASWLSRQGAQALSGDLVEAGGGSCPPPPAVPLPGTGTKQEEMEQAKRFEELLGLVETKMEARDKAKEALEKAKEEVSRWEEIRDKLQRDVSASGGEKKEPDLLLEEAIRRLQEAQTQLGDAESMEKSCDKDLLETGRLAKEAGSKQRGDIP